MADVLITGASGLIGRHVSTVRADDVAVLAVEHRSVDLLEPGRFAELIVAERPRIVLHLAWTASGTPSYRDHPDNSRWCEASAAAARACASVDAHFIGVGTVVDDTPGDDAYSRAKFALRSELADLIADGQMTWLRPFYVFDPAVPSPAVLRAGIEARDRGVAVELATPEAAHDFIHAADVGGAITTLLSEPPGGLVDLGTGSTHTVAQLVEACGVDWTRAAGTQRTDASSDAAADPSLLHAAGWSPIHTERFFGDG